MRPIRSQVMFERWLRRRSAWSQWRLTWGRDQANGDGDGVEQRGHRDRGAGVLGSVEGVEDSVRIRHYTNRRGINGIEDEGIIRARDQNQVSGESASGRPLSPVDAANK